MKKIFLGILLPLLCVVSLISSGFAVWYFDGTITNTAKVDNINLTVEKYAQVGDIILGANNGTILTFDQPPRDNVTKEYDLTKGITLNNPIRATYKPASPNYNDPTSPNYDYAINLKFDFYVVVKIPNALADYVKLNNLYTDITPAGSLERVWTKKLVADYAHLEYPLEIGVEDFDYVKAPKNLAEYKVMQDVIKNNSITFNFEAKVIPQ